MGLFHSAEAPPAVSARDELLADFKSREEYPPLWSVDDCALLSEREGFDADVRLTRRFCVDGEGVLTLGGLWSRFDDEAGGTTKRFAEARQRFLPKEPSNPVEDPLLHRAEPLPTTAAELLRFFHRETGERDDYVSRALRSRDWAAMPSLRRYYGAPVLALPPARALPGSLGAVLCCQRTAPAEVTLQTVADLLHHALAPSATRQRPGMPSYSKRCVPSSGNLHPVEAYVVAPAAAFGGSAGLVTVWHYAVEPGALELRRLVAGTGTGLCVALTSVVWRQVWKYGERGLRYARLDVGHAAAAVAAAAAALGWRATAEPVRGAALGLDRPEMRRLPAVERERPALLLRLTPGGPLAPEGGFWFGHPNKLSARHARWELVERTLEALESLPTTPPPPATPTVVVDVPADFAHVARSRRSALDFDEAPPMPRADYDRLTALVQMALRGEGAVPALAGAGPASVRALAIVCGVEGLAPGVYDTGSGALVRALADEDAARQAALDASCGQPFVARCALTLVFAAPRLFDDYDGAHHQAGAAGHAAYLAATGLGWAACGLGCFYDERPLAEVGGGLHGDDRVLYLVTVGKGAHIVGAFDPEPPAPPRVAPPEMSAELAAALAREALPGTCAELNEPGAPLAQFVCCDCLHRRDLGIYSSPSEGEAEEEKAEDEAPDRTVDNPRALTGGVLEPDEAQAALALDVGLLWPEPAPEAAALVRQRLAEHGWLTLRTGGAPELRGALAALAAACDAFFALPRERKEAYSAEMSSQAPTLGYRDVDTFREFLRQRPVDEPCCAGAAPEGFRAAWDAAYAPLFDILWAVMEAVASDTVVPTEQLGAFARDHSSLSAIHYYSSAASTTERRVCGTHEDTGLLTMGVATAVPGLQVWDDALGGFVQAERLASVGDLSVFVGKKLAMFTGSEEFPATPHRVVVGAGAEERTTQVLLLDVV